MSDYDSLLQTGLIFQYVVWITHFNIHFFGKDPGLPNSPGRVSYTANFVLRNPLTFSVLFPYVCPDYPALCAADTTLGDALHL